VGKTNLLSRFALDQFSLDSKSTIGVEFTTKTVEVDGTVVKVQAWDTAGQERFRATTHSYYKGASGAIVVFDLTGRTTWESVPKWLTEVFENQATSIACILVGWGFCM
jgi:small GTP-binding protein